MEVGLIKEIRCLNKSWIDDNSRHIIIRSILRTHQNLTSCYPGHFLWRYAPVRRTGTFSKVRKNILYV